MNPWPVDEEVAEVHLPRPGHADLVGTQKYKQQRRAQHPRARLRARDRRARGGRRAVQGVPARARRRGPLARRPDRLRARARRASARSRSSDFAEVDSSPVRCLDAEATRAMVREIDDLRKANESLGGVFEVQAFGLVPGLGSHVSWEERLDGRLAMAICSIQAIKGVVDRRRASRSPACRARRPTTRSSTRPSAATTARPTAPGGLEGGMTNGLPLIVRGAMKPLPTLTKPLRSVDIETHEPAQALRERTDSCTVPAAGVVGEAMVALVLADAYRQQVRRRPHRRRARGACAPTRSGSDGQ